MLTKTTYIRQIDEKWFVFVIIIQFLVYMQNYNFNTKVFSLLYVGLLTLDSRVDLNREATMTTRKQKLPKCHINVLAQ